MGEWQPIKTAPAVGKKRLLFALKRGGIGVGYRNAGSDYVHLDYAETNPFLATHWQPLPEAP